MTAAAGYVLAGGRSSRMGTDKALVELAGRPLITHALDLLRLAGLPGAIAGARSDLSQFGAVVPDAYIDRGPLSGICSALADSSAEFVIFTTVDLPLLPASLISYMLYHAGCTGLAVTIASVSGFPETFPVVIQRETLPALKAELEAGRGSCVDAFRAAAKALGQEPAILPVELLVQAGHVEHSRGLPAFQWFLNVNAPEELKLAVRLVA